MSTEKPVAAAVNRMLDGGLVPQAGTSSPLRRVELAAMWLSEATAELNDAILEAKSAGVGNEDIGRAAGVSGEAIRQRWVKAKLGASAV